MSASMCPFCGALVNFTLEHQSPDLPPALVQAGFSPQHFRLLVLRCNNERCAMTIMALASPDSRLVKIWPESPDGKAFPDVPDHIAQAADEAYRCFSINALRAATLLARSVIEATAKAKGITGGNLVKKIDDMQAAGFIRPDVAEGAHEVRYLGNDMAHGDFVQPVDADEAELALTLMAEVLEEVFQAPARIAGARAKRVAKKAGQAAVPQQQTP